MANEGDRKEPAPACDCGGGSCCGGPGRWVWIALTVVAVGLLMARNQDKRPGPAPAATTDKMPAAAVGATSAAAPRPATADSPLPRLVDLGAGKCIPCKMMAPILEDLKTTYAGTLDVVFIDVWENPDAGTKYGINMIPTQIFYDAAGKERFRHEGFFGKDDILAKWKELGVELNTNSHVRSQDPE